MKYLLSNILLAYIMLFSLTQAAKGATKIGDIYYELSGSEANVTYSKIQSGEYSGEITIPNEVTYGSKTYTVKAINDFAFSSCKKLTSIVFPNTLTTIGRSAFYNCTGLTTVAIPNSVTTISEKAFNSCTALTNVTIGSGIQEIGGLTFYNCPLTSVTIKAVNPPTLGSDVFSNTTFSLIVPNACKDSYAAAENWSSITDITEIGNGTKVSSLTFGSSKKFILVNKTVKQEPIILPDDAEVQELTWSSGNTSVATVTADGTVTGKAQGTAIITATTTDGSDVSATYKVMVFLPGLPGDVNGDGDITIADANAIVNIYLKE